MSAQTKHNKSRRKIDSHELCRTKYESRQFAIAQQIHTLYNDSPVLIVAPVTQFTTRQREQFIYISTDERIFRVSGPLDVE